MSEAPSRFPELFTLSSSQSTQKRALETAAFRQEEQYLAEAVRVNQKVLATVDRIGPAPGPFTGKPSLSAALSCILTSTWSRSSSTRLTKLGLLSPTYLPLETQKPSSAGRSCSFSTLATTMHSEACQICSWPPDEHLLS